MDELWSLVQDSMDVIGILVVLGLLAIAAFAILRAGTSVAQSIGQATQSGGGGGRRSGGGKGKGGGRSGGGGSRGGGGGSRGGGGGGRGGSGGGIGGALAGAGKTLEGLGKGLEGLGKGGGALGEGLGKGTGYLADGVGKLGKSLASGVGTLSDKVAKPLLSNGERLIREGGSGVKNGAKKLKEWDDRKQQEKREREAREAQSKADREARRQEWEEERRRMKEEREATLGQGQTIDMPTTPPIAALATNATRYPIDDANGPLLAGMLAQGGVRFAISEDETGQHYIVINDEDNEEFQSCLDANEVELDSDAGQRCEYDESDEIDNDAIVEHQAKQEETEVKEEPKEEIAEPKETKDV